MIRFVKMAAGISVLVGGLNAHATLDKSDACYTVVTELSEGIARSSLQFGEKAKVVELKLNSATEVRNYSLTVDEKGCLNSFDIQLSNDSASKCVIESINSTQYCG